MTGIPVDIDAVGLPEKVVVLPWSINLSKLAKYGYSKKEIKDYERQMMSAALNASDLGNNKSLKTSPRLIKKVNRRLSPYHLKIENAPGRKNG